MKGIVDLARFGLAGVFMQRFGGGLLRGIKDRFDVRVVVGAVLAVWVAAIGVNKAETAHRKGILAEQRFVLTRTAEFDSRHPSLRTDRSGRIVTARHGRRLVKRRGPVFVTTFDAWMGFLLYHAAYLANMLAMVAPIIGFVAWWQRRREDEAAADHGVGSAEHRWHRDFNDRAYARRWEPQDRLLEPRRDPVTADPANAERPRFGRQRAATLQRQR